MSLNKSEEFREKLMEGIEENLESLVQRRGKLRRMYEDRERGIRVWNERMKEFLDGVMEDILLRIGSSRDLFCQEIDNEIKSLRDKRNHLRKDLSWKELMEFDGEVKALLMRDLDEGFNPYIKLTSSLEVSKVLVKKSILSQETLASIEAIHFEADDETLPPLGPEDSFYHLEKKHLGLHVYDACKGPILSNPLHARTLNPSGPKCSQCSQPLSPFLRLQLAQKYQTHLTEEDASSSLPHSDILIRKKEGQIGFENTVVQDEDLNKRLKYDGIKLKKFKLLYTYNNKHQIPCPTSIAKLDDNLFVCSPQLEKIAVLNLQSENGRSFLKLPNGNHYQCPKNIVTCYDQILILDLKAIHIFLHGRLIKSSFKDKTKNFRGLSVDRKIEKNPQKFYIYTLETKILETNAILMLDMEQEAILKRIILHGTEDVSIKCRFLSVAHNIAIVTDLGTGKIFKSNILLGTSELIKRSYGSKSASKTTGVEYDPNNDIFIVATNNGFFEILDKDGIWIKSFAFSVENPAGIYLEDNKLYIADNKAKFIYYYHFM